MAGTVYEDFNSQIISLRNAYLRAISFGNWPIACHIGELMNKSISQKNRLKEDNGKDLQPVIVSSFQKDIRQRSRLADKYREWCMTNMPLIEDAISRERTQLLASFGSE